MKKFIAIITLVSVLSFAGCSEKAESSTESAASTASSTAEESSAEGGNTEESSDAEAVPVNEEDYFDWYGVRMYYPDSDMDREDRNHRRTANVFDSDAGIYSEIYTFATNAAENQPEIPISDIPNDESIFDTICHGIDVYYPCQTTSSQYNPESEEKVEVLGKEFIKQKGTFHAKSMSDEIDLTYVAYFGLMDFKENNYTNCPTMWIALSELNDDATKAQLEKRVDTAAQNMEYTK